MCHARRTRWRARMPGSMQLRRKGRRFRGIREAGGASKSRFLLLTCRNDKDLKIGKTLELELSEAAGITSGGLVFVAPTSRRLSGSRDGRQDAGATDLLRRRRARKPAAPTNSLADDRRPPAISL